MRIFEVIEYRIFCTDVMLCAVPLQRIQINFEYRRKSLKPRIIEWYGEAKSIANSGFQGALVFCPALRNQLV
jgi:hypothetical protein